jgi:hypothetical protein
MSPMWILRGQTDTYGLVSWLARTVRRATCASNIWNHEESQWTGLNSKCSCFYALHMDKLADRFGLILGYRCRYEETWVALNWEIRLPTKETHPDFPLWKMGYSSEDEYNLFFPKDFRFLCNPRRPAVCGRFGQTRDRLWRFEFVVQPGEDPQEMSEPHKIRDIVLPYLRHPGTRYG